MWTTSNKKMPRENPAYGLITLGCDPEFLFLDRTGHIAKAEGVLSSMIDNGLRSKLGWDGAHTPAELRPSPSRDVSKVVSRLQKLIIKHPLADRLSEYEWLCGSGSKGVPIGGHIHIGLWGLTSEGVAKPTNPALTYSRSMASMLEAILLPFAISLSDTREFESRLGGNYGKMGDVRRDHPWGIEWRTLPSWLYDPWVAYFFLAGAKLIALEFASGGYNVEGLAGTLPLDLFYQSGDIARLRTLALKNLDTYANLARELEGWEENKQYEKALCHVLELVSAGIVWDNVDFKNNWHSEIPGPETERRKNIVFVARPSLQSIIDGEVLSMFHRRETCVL